MRHRVDTRRLGRYTSHRLAMLSNMTASLILEEKITTTLLKAKELRRVSERLITRAKGGRFRIVGWLLPACRTRKPSRNSSTRSHRGTRIGRAVTPASSSWGTGRATLPRWRSSNWFNKRWKMRMCARSGA